MRAAVAAILDGMPDPADLHVHEHDGEVWVLAGSRVLASWRAGDSAMRNMTAVVLTGLGFAGKDVAAALGLSTGYVSMLRSRARSEGSAGAARRPGRPAWGGEGMADAEIGRRRGVHGTTVARWLGPRQSAEPAGAAGGPAEAELLFSGSGTEPGPGTEPGAVAEPAPGGERVPAGRGGPAAGEGPAGFRAAAGPRIGGGGAFPPDAGRAAAAAPP